MMLDFPSSPTLGQKYPSPPVGTQPVYLWDGEKWTTVGGRMGGKSVVYTDGSAAMTDQLTLVDPPVLQVHAASKKYVDARVRYDTDQGLTTPMKRQARLNIDACSSAASLARGMQFNGCFDVNQEYGTGGMSAAMQAQNVATCDTYFGDGWKLVAKGGGAGSSLVCHTLRANAIGCALPSYMQVYCDSHAFNVTGPSDYCVLRHFVEGYRMAYAMFGTSVAKPVTLGFWMNCDNGVSGNMGVTLRNAAANRICTNTVAIIPGWNYYITTFPGDTAGTWTNDNGIGYYLDFCLACSPGLNSTTSGVWGTSGWFGSVGQTLWLNTNSVVVQMSGVIMVVGTDAPSGDQIPYAMRTSDEEMRIAQRYFNKFGAGMNFYPRCTGDTFRMGQGHHPVWMRATPTMTVTGVVNYAGGQVASSAQGYNWGWASNINLNDTTSTYTVLNVTANARL